MSLTNIEMPKRVADLPRTKDGVPILHTTAYIDGKADLRVSDPEKREECCAQKLCGICGQKLDYWIYFVTGKLGEKNRTFSDPPMHKECLEYALQVCPFLLGQRTQHTADTLPGALIDQTAVLHRPPEIGLYRTRGYKRVRVGSRSWEWLFLADAPSEIEWRNPQENTPANTLTEAKS